MTDFSGRESVCPKGGFLPQSVRKPPFCSTPFPRPNLLGSRARKWRPFAFSGLHLMKAKIPHTRTRPLKLRSGFRGTKKGRTSASREWRTKSAAHASHLLAPQPFGFAFVRCSAHLPTDCIGANGPAPTPIRPNHLCTFLSGW